MNINKANLGIYCLTTGVAVLSLILFKDVLYQSPSLHICWLEPVYSPSSVTFSGSLNKLYWLVLSSCCVRKWRSIRVLDRLCSLSPRPESFIRVLWPCFVFKLGTDKLLIFSSAWIIIEPARRPDWERNVELFLLWLTAGTGMSYSSVVWCPRSSLQNVDINVNNEAVIKRQPYKKYRKTS